MIRIATILDIDSILELTRACDANMRANGIIQWNEIYPHRSSFIKDVKRGELFVFEFKTAILGCVVISVIMDDEYIPVKWLTQTNANIYIHRLAVHPKNQRQGIAQKLMSFAENYGIKNNKSSIRLDTFSLNKRNQKFYELRGYKRLGDIYYPKQSTHPFYCYELIL